MDGDTLFHIGSITKVFTALLLQDMVERGEMKLDEVGNHLLADVRGLGREEIFPKSETIIPGFNVGDDIQITFVPKRNGKTTSVIVHWNGKSFAGRGVPPIRRTESIRLAFNATFKARAEAASPTFGTIALVELRTSW